MEDGRIRDSQIMYTSIRKGTTAFGEQARLHQNISEWGAWCPDTNLLGSSAENINYDQFVDIDLLYLTNISKIAIQGREYNGGRELVGSYKISYSKNGDDWTFYVYQGKGKPLDTVCWLFLKILWPLKVEVNFKRKVEILRPSLDLANTEKLQTLSGRSQNPDFRRENLIKIHRHDL